MKKKSIHQLGGEAVKKKYGSQHFAELAKKSHAKRKLNKKQHNDKPK